MEIKGTSVKITHEFVRDKFPADYEKWKRALPSKQQAIFSEAIIAGNWYSLRDAVLEPTRVIAELFYNGNQQKANREVGIYSAKSALTGIYRAFLLIATPSYILQRAQAVWTTFYRPAIFKIVEGTSTKAVFEINGFTKEEALLFQRLDGWVCAAIELTRRKIVKTEIRVIENKLNVTAFFTVIWE